MDKENFTEETSLKDILGSFMDSYMERDKSVEFSDWLENKLHQEIPELSEEAGGKLAGEIIEAVDAYDRMLSELNTAIASGQSKEDWLAVCLAKDYADTSAENAGEKLLQIEENIAASNRQLMQEICEVQIEKDITKTGDGFPVEWNEYSVKNKAREIGEQLTMSGIAVAANVIRGRLEGADGAVEDVFKETLQDGLIKNREEVKAVVAGAIKAAIKKGLGNIVPEDTTVDVIGIIAGVAVESAEALSDMANGKSTILETLDKIGMRAVAAGGRILSDTIKEKLAIVPYVGPILIDMAGGLLEHLQGPVFADNVWETIVDVATATWEGILQSQAGRVFVDLKKEVFG